MLNDTHTIAIGTISEQLRQNENYYLDFRIGHRRK